jgi:sugar (pentulose or hexulose) kinase
MSAREATIVVTLDIGGSAAKASAYDADRQVSLGQAARPYPAPAAGADPGLFDAGAWWLAAAGALADLRERLDQPAGRYLGLTVSAIRIPFVLTDAAGRPVMPGLLNKDRRALAYVSQAAAPFGEAGLYQLTGQWPAPEFGLAKLLWARSQYPAAWQAARTVLQLHDWFIYRLSGVTLSEPSSAAMSQMLDVRAGSWAAGLLAALDVPGTLMPDLVAAGSRAGGLTAEAARLTGFAAGTPVHVGGGDTHMSALSAAPGQGIPVVVAGTTTPTVLPVPASRLSEPPDELFPLLISEHVVAGQAILEANAGPTGGLAALAAGLDGESGPALREALIARGITLAADRPGRPLAALAGHPFFGPAGWAASAPPTVVGLTDEHRGEDVYQAFLLGIGLAVRATLGCLLRQSGTIAPFIAVTGGMSTSPAWTQLLADVTGYEVRVRPADQIAGRAGAVLVAGLSGPGPVEQEETRVHKPGAGGAQRHDQELARYQELYAQAQRAEADGQVSRAGAR